MPFIWDWIREKLSGTSKITTQPKSLGGPEVDNQVREEVVGNRGAVPAKKSNTGTKSPRVRSNNKSQASRKSPRKTVCPAAKGNKTKSKAVSKG
jgi:hypothetical protein